MGSVFRKELLQAELNTLKIAPHCLGISSGNVPCDNCLCTKPNLRDGKNTDSITLNIEYFSLES